MPEEKLFQLALTLVPGLGDILVKTLISYCGSAKRVFDSHVSKLTKVPGVGQSIARAIKQYNIKDAASAFDELESKNIQLIFYTDAQYPKRLKNIYDAPALLYLSGKVNLNHHRMLAIVGTRNATAHGKAFVKEFVKELASYNIIIVSGLAYGIDIEAHKAALQYNIPTIAVIASGLDIIYPQVHTKYANKMIETGGLLTEYPLKTTLDPARFPARNRIIAGLTDATVIVEAANKGGALITADLASGYDREVFAIPGRWNDDFSFGCNEIIKRNIAQSICSAQDLEYYMQWPIGDSTEELVITFDQDEFDENEWTVINTIGKSGIAMHIDELSWQSKIKAGQLATILLNLEFRGVVNSIPGKKYVLS